MPKCLVSVLRSRPYVVDSIFLVATIIHGILIKYGFVPNFWQPFTEARNADRVLLLYTAALGPASIVTGFAGVVVVFAISAPGERFKKLRVRAGKHLIANWSSTTSSGLLSALLFISSAVFSLEQPRLFSAMTFELGLLVLAHGAIRLTWLLRQLAITVVADDQEQMSAGSRSAQGLIRPNH